MTRLSKYVRMHSEQAIEDELARQIKLKNKQDVKLFTIGLFIFVIVLPIVSYVLTQLLGLAK